MSTPHNTRTIKVPFNGTVYPKRLDIDEIFRLEDALPGGIQPIMIGSLSGVVSLKMSQMAEFLQVAIGDQLKDVGLTVKDVLAAADRGAPVDQLRGAITPLLQALYEGLHPPKDSPHYKQLAGEVGEEGDGEKKP